ncbi:hypothetical protein DE146DRAFT_133324 [Phaeosphaeria sp. MPI-PUGE-AT-0046c]|nr:hypothetical protein DE146DRAFT_133324 [Phaeosphaeria sp. MPI-PUGE-AT-0046c]
MYPIGLAPMSGLEERNCVEPCASSISGSTISPGQASTFDPVVSLHIDSKGLALIRLPLPPSQLEIEIRKSDGSLAYTSKRSKRCSGNCSLLDASGTPLITTKYFFGPCREPIISLLDCNKVPEQNVKLTSKWNSRKYTYLLPDGRTFAWQYAGKKTLATFGIHGAKSTALVLKLGGEIVAALIRNEDTRTPGTTYFSAGNGGELLLGAAVNNEDGLSEELIVATCLLMLKKECDRRRAVQFMVISGALY